MSFASSMCTCIYKLVFYNFHGYTEFRNKLHPQINEKSLPNIKSTSKTFVANRWSIMFCRSNGPKERQGRPDQPLSRQLIPREETLSEYIETLAMLSYTLASPGRTQPKAANIPLSGHPVTKMICSESKLKNMDSSSSHKGRI